MEAERRALLLAYCVGYLRERRQWKAPGLTLNRVFVGVDRKTTAPPRGAPFPPTLTFTPSNWDQWQAVKVKVACAAHYRQAVPLKHVIEAVQFHSQVGPRRVNYGTLDQTWTVWVDVEEADAPIEVMGLAGGDTITLDEGSHKDFQISVSKDLLPDGSGNSINVRVTAWDDSLATAVRRDGSARPCGSFDDCITASPSRRRPASNGCA